MFFRFSSSANGQTMQTQQRHSLKLGRKRRESFKRNYYIISPKVIIKAIIIMVLNNTCECMPTLRKNAYGLVHAHLSNGAAASLPWKLLRTYLESCANIMQAVVYRPPSCRRSVA